MQCVDAMECYPVVKENKEDLNKLVQKALQDTLVGEKKQVKETYTLCDPVYFFFKYYVSIYIYMGVYTCMDRGWTGFH